MIVNSLSSPFSVLSTPITELPIPLKTSGSDVEGLESSTRFTCIYHKKKQSTKNVIYFVLSRVLKTCCKVEFTEAKESFRGEPCCEEEY